MTGSNPLDILLIPGITALVSPVPVSDGFATLDIPIMLGTTLLLLPYLVTKKALGRISGIALILLYCGFVALVIAGNRWARCGCTDS